MEPNQSQIPSEIVVSNGEMLPKVSIQQKKFAIGTKFIISNPTYSMEEFRISEATEDSGTQWRRMQSRSHDVAMTLAGLQAEYGKGNIQFVDAKGEVIKE